jgi:general secretion pathway protein G
MNARLNQRRGFSLIELLAIITILGIVAAIVVPHVALHSDTAKQKLDSHNKATINAAIERWYVEKGAWPKENLADVAADRSYFPNGLPSNPVTGAAYLLDPASHRVK